MQSLNSTSSLNTQPKSAFGQVLFLAPVITMAFILTMAPVQANAGNKSNAQNWCSDYSRLHTGTACHVVHRGKLCPKGFKRMKKFGRIVKGYKTCIPGKKRAIIKQGIKKVGNAVIGVTQQGPFLNGYKAFFKKVNNKANSPISLSKNFIDIYQRYFRNNLRNVKIYESSGVAARNAMTDCHKIYFPRSSGIYGKMKKGIALNVKDKRWLLHEVVHTQQCTRVGGRNNYAIKWFSHIPIGTLKALIKGKSVENFSTRLHDKMPMESNAEAIAQRLKSI